jgi:prolipoprotein diacylglyceryltransferase
MVYEGFILVLVGALLSPRASRTFINANALDQPNAAQMAYRDLEINRLEQELEREDPSYYKNFFSQIKGNAYNLTLIIAGVIMFFYALNYL